jgi:hypothetical protein
MLNANPISAVLKYHSKLKKNVNYDLYITYHLCKVAHKNDPAPQLFFKFVI